MSEGVFRAVYRGGTWWVERYHDGAWEVCRGPYKYQAGAENWIKRKRKAEDSQLPTTANPG